MAETEHLPSCQHRREIDNDGYVRCACDRLAIADEWIPATACIGCAYADEAYARTLARMNAREKQLTTAKSSRPHTPPSGPGTELKKLFRRLGFRPAAGCKCNKHAAQMNRLGCQWCRGNIDTIVDWLDEEYRRKPRALPFNRTLAKQFVLLAIRRAEKKERRN